MVVTNSMSSGSMTFVSMLLPLTFTRCTGDFVRIIHGFPKQEYIMAWESRPFFQLMSTSKPPRAFKNL